MIEAFYRPANAGAAVGLPCQRRQSEEIDEGAKALRQRGFPKPEIAGPSSHLLDL
ncbi:hypothetical protein LJR090_003523 [Bosea sp. LjRoot90]|uniref:hypothetical protein n=1 Tax=Bosea sp. LjRoot90 TaxID=3342342 RepID=UPI003ECE5BD9